MGFMRHLKKNVPIRPEQKWDYITLQDFKSSGLKPLAYAYLYFSLILSITVYIVDSFTAVNLLVFNKWSSEIEPSISFTAARWIFSICIILSTINLLYEHIRAQFIMRRGSVVECYLDSLAARLESIRWGKGQGYKRFLVFAELTKSKKGAEYIALFTYFSFQSWIRVILCSGPRQVVNALTLYSVYTSKLSVSGDNVGNTLLNFFEKIKELAEENYQQALILSGMIFTLIIWVFSFLSLLLAFLLFLFFLWSYIPKSDGSLSAFCARKINKRLMKIVAEKVNKALEEEEKKKRKKGLKAAKKAGEEAPTQLTATIPNLGSNKLSRKPTLTRNDTMATLPAYSSRPSTPGGFELDSIDQKRGLLPRAVMMAAAPQRSSTNKTTYSARAPLLNYAAEPGMNNMNNMGNTRVNSPAPRLPNVGGGSSFGDDFTPSPLVRSATGVMSPGAPPIRQLTRANTGMMPANQYGGNQYNNMQRMQSPAPYNNMQSPASYNDMQRMQSPAPYNNMQGMPMMPQPAQAPMPYGSIQANMQQRTQSPAPYMQQRTQSPAPYMQQRTQSPAPSVRQPGHQSNVSSGSGRFMAYNSSLANEMGRASPAPSIQSIQSMQPAGYRSESPQGLRSPMRSATVPVMPAGMEGSGGFAPYAPQRMMTTPATAAGQHARQDSEQSYTSYFDQTSNVDVETQRRPGRY